MASLAISLSLATMTMLAKRAWSTPIQNLSPRLLYFFSRTLTHGYSAANSSAIASVPSSGLPSRRGDAPIMIS